ncbi:MAG: hypothetical protein EON88_36310 [Brevundimonas sp.]|nr:MAG: hypothetical protein EON88_36310 [Brevundimonas sp.]
MPRKLQILLKRLLLGFLAVVGVSFILGVVAGYMSASGAGIDEDSLFFWFALIVATACMGGAIVTSVYWMRSIDEAAREAHKAAWFWGGSGALTLLGVPVILATLPQSATWTIPTLWFGRDDPAAWLAVGCFGSLLVMIIGYSVVWAWWWLARR